MILTNAVLIISMTIAEKIKPIINIDQLNPVAVAQTEACHAFTGSAMTYSAYANQRNLRYHFLVLRYLKSNLLTPFSGPSISEIMTQ